MPTLPASELTQQARTGLSRFPWGTIATGVLGASAIGLLGAAGLAPLLAAVTGGTLAHDAFAQWLVGIGGNALAGWAGDLALWAAGKPLASENASVAQAAQRDLAMKLDALLAQDAEAATGLARLLQAIDAVPQSLIALRTTLDDQTEVLLAQHDLLARLSADVEGLGIAGGALGPQLIQQADRMITALESRADRTDARLATVLAELRALEDTQRQAVISFARAQTGDVRIGDVARRDIHKPTLGPGSIYAPGGTVVWPFTPRPVGATPDEIADAMERLAALPTDIVPVPQDILPSGSWMGHLRRNEQFVGREADLLTLATLLKGGATVIMNQGQSAVTSGLGGIGKTQLAIEFAYRYGRYFAGVFWLNCAQADTIPAEIARCGGAAHLQLFTEAAGLSLDEQVRLVRARLGCGLPYLLIFDNCEQPNLVRTHHPGGATRVLITSRNPNWSGDMGVHRHALGVLQRGESIALLRQHRPNLTDCDADALSAELGDLPLALHLAGRFLAGPGKILNVEQYLAELRSPRIFKRLLLQDRDDTLPTGHNRDVARTFALSYERLNPQTIEDEVALRLLARAAYLAPGEVIPPELLRMTLAIDPDDLEAQLDAEAAVEQLVSLGLLEREKKEGRLRIHRLVAVYARQVSSDVLAQKAVEQTVLGEAQSLIDQPALAPIAAFIPILRSVTDGALLREDIVAATLCIWLGDYLHRLSSYAQAQLYFERALVSYERILGNNHPSTATCLYNLAMIHRAQGNYEAAQPLLQRALLIQEQVLGANHPNAAFTLNSLAGLYQLQGNYEAAQPLLQRALLIQEQVLGAADPNTALTLNNLAVLHQNQGNHEAALSLLQYTLEIQEQGLGADHPNIALTLNNLARLYQLQGDYEAAQPLLQRALKIHEQVLGADHPNTALTLNNLAGLYLLQGDYRAAQPLLQRTLAIQEQVWGFKHPNVALSLNTLALIHIRQHDYEKAIFTAQRTLEIYKHNNISTLAETINNLAFIPSNHERSADSLPLVQRALALREYRGDSTYSNEILIPRKAGSEFPNQNKSSTRRRRKSQVSRVHDKLDVRSTYLGTKRSRQSPTVIHQNSNGALSLLHPSHSPDLTSLLAAIAIIAVGGKALRRVVEQDLTRLERSGRMLREPVERIWAGERNRDALVTGLGLQDTAFIERVLELISERKFG